MLIYDDNKITIDGSTCDSSPPFPKNLRSGCLGRAKRMALLLLIVRVDRAQTRGYASCIITSNMHGVHIYFALRTDTACNVHAARVLTPRVLPATRRDLSFTEDVSKRFEAYNWPAPPPDTLSSCPRVLVSSCPRVLYEPSPGFAGTYSNRALGAHVGGPHSLVLAVCCCARRTCGTAAHALTIGRHRGNPRASQPRLAQLSAHRG